MATKLIVTIAKEDGTVLEKYRVWPDGKNGPVDPPPSKLAAELADLITFWLASEKVQS
jgi:hypothetical protein